VAEQLQIAHKVREALVREGLLSPGPDQSIPVRYRPDPHTCILGFLDIYPMEVDGDTEHYSMAFRAAPLHGEQPRFDLTVTPQEVQP
jgi:hypothetical protein